MSNEANIPLEIVQNYIRLQNLINSIALPALRKIFTDNWKTKYHCEWLNSEDFGSQFIGDVGENLFKQAQKFQKRLLSKGNIDEWDLPLIIDALKCFQNDIFPNPNLKSNKELNKNFDILKGVRNQLSHQGKLKIDNKSFEKMWKDTSNVLLSFGISHSEIDKAKIATLQENKDNTQKAKKLKEEGNLHFKKENFDLAIAKYTEAILQPGLHAKELAVLYSNRSIANRKRGNYYKAKEDAKGAIHLNPNWWKGFSRLGQAYLCIVKYEQALENFEQALKLEPGNKEMEDELGYCRHMISKLQRNDHLDPIQHVQTFAEYINKLQQKNEMTPYAPTVFKRLTELPEMKETLVGMCREGNKYLHGLEGVPQSYEMAAKWFSKAASRGNAEGLYNLARLTNEGKGVQRSASKAIRLLELAASQNITMTLEGMVFPNIGVVEAEHSLGLYHQNGVGVPQDFQKALQWYIRAIKHGSGISANNVGVIYERGIGVPQNCSMALHYYKLSAYRKVVRAMENVAVTYLYLYDKENARKWFQFAIHNGSLSLQTNKNDFLALVGKELEKPIKNDVFELELIKEVKNGPLKKLIIEDKSLYDNTLKHITRTLKDVESNRVATSRKEQGLTDPYRVSIITQHRNELKEMKSRKHIFEFWKGEGKLLPKTNVDFFSLKRIHFAGMDYKKDHIYEGFAIKLTLIEDAVIGRPSVCQIAEDENGDAQRIFIYNCNQDKETQNSLGFGCKITVMNPYFRLAKDGMPMIRIDDTSLMYLHSNLTNKKRCRYCGNENEQTVSCRTCNRSFYCSKLCLKMDSTLLNHKDICFKRL